MRRFAIGLLAALTAAAQQPTTSWKLAYQFDEDQSNLTLVDIATAPPECVIAVGALTVKGRTKPTSVISRDGGGHWTVVPLKEEPRTLFFAKGQTGWMVAEKGLFSTTDCGTTWTRALKQDDLVRVYFRDEQNGFAVGAPKKVLETKDGGKTWTKVAAADEPKSNPERTAYNTIAFRATLGLITGFHEPRRPDEANLPAWMDPSEAKRRRQWPSLTLMLQTVDGGTTWKPGATSILGKISQIRLGPAGVGMILVEFDKSFDYPSEIYQLGFDGKQAIRVYREKTRAITDIAILNSGHAYLVGYEPPGALHQLPIPGKVKILQSTDWKTWAEMPVDYRAVARDVMVAYAPDGPVFAATDTGMILTLKR